MAGAAKALHVQAAVSTQPANGPARAAGSRPTLRCSCNACPLNLGSNKVKKKPLVCTAMACRPTCLG